MNERRISVVEAAKMMCKPQQFVRLLLQRNLVDWGYAIKLNKKWSYHISPHKFYEYMGKPERNDKNNDSIQ